MLVKIRRYLLLFLLVSNISYAKQPIIIDTDMAADDVLAISYLLKNPQVQIKAISIAADGATTCESALKNLEGLLKLAHHENIPHACGRRKPLEGRNHFPENYRKEANYLSGVAQFLPRANDQYRQKSAIPLLFSVLKQSKQKIDIIAIAPLTNIAQLLTEHPDIKKKIHHIYIMGGALKVPGNITSLNPHSNNKSSEWNFYIDPKAVKNVLSSGLPITLVTLDATNQVPLTMAFIHKLSNAASKNNELINFLLKLLTKQEVYIKNHDYFFWDPLVAVLAANPSLACCKFTKVDVVLRPENMFGKIFLSNKGYSVRYVVTDSPSGIYEQFIHGVTKKNIA